MGQIVFNGQRPKYCNLQAIQTGGQHVDDAVALKEIWLIDTSNSTSKSETGTGRYDAYIIGDGIKTAGQLAETDLRYIDTEGSGGGGNNPDNEDLTSVSVQGNTVLKFNNKLYDASLFSGYGRKFLRKHIVTEAVKEYAITEDSIKTGKYFNLAPTIGETIAGTELTMSSLGCFKIPVNTGDVYRITANIADQTSQTSKWSTRMWSLTDNNNVVLNCYKPNNENFSGSNRKETVIINVEQDGILWVNTIIYNGGVHIVKKLEDTSEQVTINCLEQSDFTEENTVYIVQYDYNCNQRTIRLPKNSVLYFAGGSIKNSCLNGNKTSITTDYLYDIFGNSEIVGSWRTREWHPEWFGAGTTDDDTASIQRVLQLSEDISSHVDCVMYGRSYKTTKGLLLYNNTSIFGGTITAQFENQLDWVLQTYSLYNNVKVVGYSVLSSWQEHDQGNVKQTNGGVIQDLTINGVLNQHMVEQEVDGETVKVWDGTYSPIYGGIKIQATRTINTYHVKITNVGIGMARGTCLKTFDNDLEINACYTAFAGYAINGHSIRDSYLNAHCHFQSDGESDKKQVVPYHTEYQVFTVKMNNFMSTYIEGTGGIDDSDDSKKRPLFCSIKLLYAYSMVLENILVDGYCDVGVAGTWVGVSITNPWWEAVTKCFLYGLYARMTLNTPISMDSEVEYDLIGDNSNFTLINCEGRVTCSGGTTGTSHKYAFSNSKVNAVCSRTSSWPNNDSFYFLTNGDVGGFSTVTVSGESLNAEVGKYYTFSSTVNTLVVTLPEMTSITVLKAVIFYITTGDTPNLTFSSIGNKEIVYYNNYNIQANSTYEINCMYNGVRWIVSASVIG